MPEEPEVPDEPLVPLEPDVPDEPLVPDEPAFNKFVFFTSFVVLSTTTTSKSVEVSGKSGVNTLPENDAEPVLLNEPDIDISYASAAVNASTDWETCQELIVKPCEISSTFGLKIFSNLWAIRFYYKY